ncbi:hypothetical protein [Burkholderia multivorans]|uniref:hypothetical protein n=1 Tax=Burkholderia multivorans TaxID=87883 RepID=UPI0021C2390E|nr:hypothetical protein [Burkholderia multivorans]
MNAPEIHIDPSIGEVFELLHRMTMCDTRAARVWLCYQLKREIKALNDERMARLNEALASAGA